MIAPMKLAKPFAWSYSVLDMYDTCPKKYYHIKIAKDARDEDSSYATDGKLVHDALFKRVTQDVPLPLPMRHMERTVGNFALLPGEKHGELQLALTKDLQPCGWFDKDAWVRAIIDFLLINKKHALIVDWKTGKVKDDFTQIKLSAAVLSRVMPEIEKFTVAYVWVNQNHVSPLKLEKQHMKAIWADLFPRVNEIQAALKTTDFPATPTPLCGWCPVRQCPHNTKK